MEDKIKLVENFNIDNYFEYQSRFYDELPEWVTKEQSEIEKKALEEWEKYRDSIKIGQPSTKHEGQELELSEKAKQAIQEHKESQNNIQLLHDLEMPILSYHEFNGLKEIIYNGIKTDIKQTKWVLDLKIMDKETIFKNEKDKALELVNISILKYLQQPMPLSKIHLLEAISTFCAVGLIQWINEQEKKEVGEQSPVEELPNYGYRLPMPIKWKGGNKENGTAVLFYYLIGELKRKGWFEGDYHVIAKWLYLMFDNVGTESTILRGINSKKFPPPGGYQNVDELLNGI